MKSRKVVLTMETLTEERLPDLRKIKGISCYGTEDLFLFDLDIEQCQANVIKDE